MERKVVLITGAGKGIGRAIARKFASNGYNIILNYNSSKDLAMALANELKTMVEVLTIQADISDEQQVKTMVDKSIERFGKIDVLVNNSAVCFDKLFYDKTKEDFDRTFAVNVTGTFLVSKYVGEKMLEKKNGNIINLTSTNAINTYFPMCIDYDASKSAIISLTHNLAVQFAPFINVNAVAPGFVGTDSELNGMDEEFISSEIEKVMVKRMGTEQDVANLVSFLASNDASFINNQVIKIDGGIYGD